MTANPLVAQRVDTTSPLAGTGIVEDGHDLVEAIRSGSWVQGGIAAFSVAADTAAAVSDPLGALFAAGLGWLMDHLSPLTEWLEKLAGDADQVRAFSATWGNVATQLSTAGSELARKVNADLAEMAGAAADAYRALTGDLVDHLGTAAGWAAAMSTGLTVAATIVQVVHDLVRDTLAQLVGSIISWAVELAATLGLATPLVIEQVSTRVASLATRLGTTVTHLLESVRHLGTLLESLRGLMRRAGSLYDDLLHGTDRAAHVADDVRGTATGLAHGAARSPLPDISDLPHPRDGADVGTWAQAVADRHGSLTADEVASIYRYTTNDGYQEMNGLLRGTSNLSPQDATRIQADVDQAVAGLGKLPTVSGTTLRGTNLPDSVLAQVVTGERFPDPAFLSTTTKQAVAQQFRGGGNTLIRIDGFSGVDVRALSHFGNEAEVLFPPAANLVVAGKQLSTDGGHWIISLVEE